MIPDFLSLDYSLFLFIHQLPHNALFDFLAGVFTAGSGIIWFLIIAIIILLRQRKLGQKLVRLVIISGILTYFTVVVILKPIFARPRPDMLIPETLPVANSFDALIPLSFNDYAFPSGHATIAFACFYLLAKLKSRQKLWWFLLSFLVSFSRVYLGKHYPSDVIVGAILGLLIGWATLKITNYKYILKSII